ncbi:uncharacterized protein PADG_04388 [Paracoccidioides brasiliensis Pb18]|uniref:Uncharacterized protein n=2 Tax=Paracoccidioides brasiliensis TaxID=121759 RepID=C1GAV2_PARBD|nr:uncharacterized protein PADG_04388 [Paracoccidioides brasiliensis Pb18]EEH48304.2 hypothetical protein PADG_04388 [Paracoccidioides brasiliensis Pb18]ODH43992.1 hypothetical protein ACO22_00964 [Paracoccidioides brasiliensis]
MKSVTGVLCPPVIDQMASEEHSPHGEYTAGEEHSNGIPTAWNDLSYHGRATDINEGFLEPEWVSLHLVHNRLLSVDARHSPSLSQSHNHHEISNRSIGDPANHPGLGMSVLSTANDFQSDIFTFGHHHCQVPENNFSSEAVEGFGPRALNGVMQSNASVPRSTQLRVHVNIAPNPDGLLRLQLEGGRSQNVDTTKRRRSWPSQRNSAQRSKPEQIERENHTIRLLRKEKKLSWRDVVTATNEEYGKNYSVSCLQMRMTRMKQRSQHWSENNIQALHQVHNFLGIVKV